MVKSEPVLVMKDLVFLAARRSLASEEVAADIRGAELGLDSIQKRSLKAVVPNWCVVLKFQGRRKRAFTSFHFYWEKLKTT